MNSRYLSRFMWSEALALLEEADRLHRQFVRPAVARVPTWEPPVDVVETTDQLRVTLALPGVSAETIELSREPDAIIISARRAFPVGASESQRGARVHALEIPHGRFERRIALSAQRVSNKQMSLVEQRLQDGCLTLIFSKKDAS